jgi:hypothetical protein
MVIKLKENLVVSLRQPLAGGLQISVLIYVKVFKGIPCHAGYAESP